jgi:transcriptional regulator with XRE-family HTH domain
MIPKNVDPAFRDRLQRLMRDKGKTQADLARQIFGTTEEIRGDQVYEVPRNRQTFSKYLSGKSYPSEETKRKLADALGVTMMELFPNDDPENKPGSGITFKQLNKRDALLELHVELPVDKAMEVIRIVREYAK